MLMHYRTLSELSEPAIGAIGAHYRGYRSQMSKAGLAQCTTMPKMRGLRPSHMHSISMAKGQQQEQQQPDEESGRHRAPACSHAYAWSFTLFLPWLLESPPNFLYVSSPLLGAWFFW